MESRILESTWQTDHRLPDNQDREAASTDKIKPKVCLGCFYQMDKNVQ